MYIFLCSACFALAFPAASIAPTRASFAICLALDALGGFGQPASVLGRERNLRVVGCAPILSLKRACQCHFTSKGARDG
eukprot:scaffold163046_cov46-Prasinocladus_malaysianus.AAC.1